MNGNGTKLTQERLVLRSRISDLVQVPSWVHDFAMQCAIPEDTEYAMDICLEEVLANIVLHGYAGAEDRPMSVSFAMPRAGNFVLVVEDEAPHFNPLDVPELPVMTPDNEVRLGGHGLRLLHHFSTALAYEPKPTGNRLRMEFSAAGSEAQTR
ncbi:MAG TPA: ATP-binding protein [Candidatus Acidoferrales bacterium]|jgi:serine/threonine-protein kinase RsbW|nr:ATP-binding protein [Candidatus Acidoferrales bacterium]